MRYSALLAASFILVAVPAMAQDRTPPAGSLRALQVPGDVRPSQFEGFFGTRAPFEGRSAYDRSAPDLRDQGLTDGR